MEENKLNFDPQKILIIDIDMVQPNSWNPKDEDTKEFDRVVSSLDANGLRIPIVVREVEDHFEIIDGEQRWRACKKLQYQKVLIYNEGKVEEKRAKELTIWYQQQVPFDEIKLSGLVQEMTGLYPDFKSPFTDIEVKEFVKIAEFQNNPPVSIPKDEKQHLVMFSITVTIEQLEVIEHALSLCINNVKKEDGIDIEKPRASELISADFMAS